MFHVHRGGGGGGLFTKAGFPFRKKGAKKPPTLVPSLGMRGGGGGGGGGGDVSQRRMPFRYKRSNNTPALFNAVTF